MTTAADGALRGAAVRPWFWGTLLAGLIASGCYEVGRVPSIGGGLTVFGAAVAVGLWRVRPSRHALLCRYILLLYALPFVHLGEYLVYDMNHFAQQPFIFGLTANPYERDASIVAATAFAGAVGALGLVAGMLLAGAAVVERHHTADSGRRLRCRSGLLLALLALGFSWASAPRQTVFEAAYTQSQSPLAGSNFNAAYLLSYVFAAALAIDALLERRTQIRRFKVVLTGSVLAIIIVWFQFLRGDRECLGLVAAVGALALFDRRNLGAGLWRRKRVIAAALAVAMLVATAQYVGVVRSGAVGRSLSQALREARVSAMYGTWSAALLTPLSVVGDFEKGRMTPRWGRTYVDYLLSTPPGFVAAAIGYERPIEGTRGPAWEMRYGIGGTHLMVVPFMNFRTPGVLVILLVYGFIVGVVESRVRRARAKTLLWYSTFFILGPFWVWYGEMSLVRGIMAFYVVWVTYRLLPKTHPDSSDDVAIPVAAPAEARP